MTSPSDHRLSIINHPLLLRARIVAPVAQPPIQDGGVLVFGQRVAAVGRWRDMSPRNNPRQTLDLGERVLMPGLVNAHCHLDYTDMAGQFLPPKLFSDWLKLITVAKAEWGYSEYAASWLKGARMLLRTGTTSVADIEAVPELLPEVRRATPLRVFSFLEMIGIRGQRQPHAVIQEAIARIEALKGCRGDAGLSPHAPYSTVPELLRLSAEITRRRKWRLTTHVAESALEFEMFTHGRGQMFDWLQRSGRDMSDCGLGSPVRHLDRCGALSERMLAAHVNYLAKGDAALLGERQVHVVHCPRCHRYFSHDPFPLRRLAQAGVNVCLGTDSLASVHKPRHQSVELNLFEEMRALAENEPSLSARKIVRMATLNGARALGLSGQIGELAEGSFADLVALPFAGKVADTYDGVLRHTGDVAASMIDGQWVIEPVPC
jgi:cytosine/adenosine deaminase-related metal-dependent hydrolase